MSYRRRAVALVVAVIAAAGLPTPVAADTLRLGDPADDVQRSESGSLASEPRIDITTVEVVHEAASLRVTVGVAAFTALDEAAWMDSLALGVVLVDAEDASWFWSFVPDGGGGAFGTLLSISGERFFECETPASASAARNEYVLEAEGDCLGTLPLSLGVGVAMTYDPDATDDDFDTPFDVAPDEGITELVPASDAPIVARIAGPDRIDTAIALSVDRFDDGQAPAAVLAASAASADAVTGGPLAVANSGPLLLTGSERLDPRVADELDRVLAPGSEVLLVGGTSALADSLVAELRTRGFRPRRVAGADRFATAVAVAEDIGAHELVLIADGRIAAEALLAGAAAATLGGVVVLSDGESLPPATDAYLADDPTRHLAVGTAALAAPGAERVTGATMSELSQNVLDRLLPDVRMLAVASESGIADALAGSVHLAMAGGGLLLTNEAELSPATGDELAERKDELREVVLYGGTASLSANVADAITAAVR